MAAWRRVLVQCWNAALGVEQNIRASHNAMKTIVSEHERIHAGKAWNHNQEHFLLPSTFGYYLFLVNSLEAGEQLHIRDYGFTAGDGPVKLKLFRGAFFDANSLGTSLPLYNLSDISSNESGCALYGAPFVDVNSLGDNVGFVFHPNSPALGGLLAGGEGGGSPPVTERIANPDLGYIFQMENLATDTVTLESRFFVYRTGDS